MISSVLSFFSSIFFLLHTGIPIPHSSSSFVSFYFSTSSSLGPPHYLCPLSFYFSIPQQTAAHLWEKADGPLREGWWRSRVTKKTKPLESPCNTTSSSSPLPDKSACLFLLFLIFFFPFFPVRIQLCCYNK